MPISSYLLDGLNPQLVEVIHTKSSDRLTITGKGLPEHMAMELRVMVEQAFSSLGFQKPSGSILISGSNHRCTGWQGLALPIILELMGVQFVKDPPIVVGWLFFTQHLPPDVRVAVVRGAVAFQIAAQKAGRDFVHPEGSLLSHVLQEAQRGRYTCPPPLHQRESRPTYSKELPDAPLVALAAVDVAAQSGENVIIIGPPGFGKGMLAQRLQSQKPSLTLEEAEEVASIWSIAGLMDLGEPLPLEPLLRVPHHTAGPQGLLGSPLSRPGELSLAHRGVLLLDNIEEFPLENLRQIFHAARTGSVLVYTRQGTYVTFPSQAQIIATATPCPCGFHNTLECQCSEDMVRRHTRRLGRLMTEFRIVVRL